MALTDAQKQQLKAAFDKFIALPNSAALITAKENDTSLAVPAGEDKRVWATTRAFGEWLTRAENSSIPEVAQVRTLIADPNVRQLDVEAEVLALAKKNKRTLFTIPGLGIPVTTGAAIGAGAGGLLSFLATRLLGPEASEGVMGYLLPVVGVVAGGFAGSMIEDYMTSRSSGSGTGTTTAQNLRVVGAEGAAQNLQLNVKVGEANKSATLVGTRQGNNLLLTGITVADTFGATGTSYNVTGNVVLRGDTTGQIVVGGTTAEGQANLAAITRSLGTRVPGFRLVQADGADPALGEPPSDATLRVDLGTNNIGAPPSTPVVQGPNLNQPQMGG